MVSKTPGRIIALALLILCMGAAAVAHSQEIDISVDRTELVRGETVVLTIRIHGQQGVVPNNLDPLRENFEIIQTRSSTQMRAINNITETWTDYQLTLFPRQIGEVEIPSLQIGNHTTQPISLVVQAQSQASMEPGQAIYMETELNKQSVYVQEQVLFTIRLYYTINGIRNPVFTELEMDNAVIQMIGSPNQYEKLIDGQRYGVYEKQYVIFPQRSGEMVIPDIVFRGEVSDGSSNRVFRAVNTRNVTAFSEGYTIEVKERPAIFPGATWLPAENIIIEEQWSEDLTQLRAGDSVTRTIRLTAEGLDGAALPPLQREQIDRLNLYPEPPQVERTFIDGSIVGTRIEVTSMVATEAGSVVIPAISLPWWDVNNEELRYAQLPEAFLMVRPPLGAPAAQDEPLNDAAGDAAGNERGSLNTTSLQEELSSPVSTPAWILALAALVAVLIIAGWYLLQGRLRGLGRSAGSQPSTRPDSAHGQEIADAQEAQAHKRLEASCEAGDPVRIRQALIAWGRQFYRDPDLITLEDLYSRSDNAELTQSCLRIQEAAYGSQPERAAANLRSETARLLEEVSALRSQRRNGQAHQRSQDEYALPPLYRA